MHVSDILAKKGAKVFTLYPDAAVSEAVREMDARGIGAVIITDRKGGVEGILSERDIVRALARMGVGVLNAPVSDLMTRPVHTRHPETTLDEVMSMMTHGRFRHVPIVEGGHLVGVVSIGDVVKHRLKEMELEVGVLRDVARAAVH